jgi:hypothetical protein
MESGYDDYAKPVPTTNIFLILTPDRTYTAAKVHNAIDPRLSILPLDVSGYEGGKSME